MTSSSHPEIPAGRECVSALIEQMRAASAAIARRNLPALEESVRLQQELAGTIGTRPRLIHAIAESDTQLFAALARQTALLAQIVRRSSLTVGALLLLNRPDDELYSPATLPRR